MEGRLVGGGKTWVHLQAEEGEPEKREGLKLPDRMWMMEKARQNKERRQGELVRDGAF